MTSFPHESGREGKERDGEDVEVTRIVDPLKGNGKEPAGADTGRAPVV